MSSPATVSEYGKFIDLQRFTGAQPEKSGSIYLSGSESAEKLHTNVGISAAGSVTAVGSFIIGSADMSEADLEKLDGITNGTVAADKAVVVDANKDASGFRHVTAAGAVTAGTSFIIGSADMDETDLEKLDGITNGTAAANKAVVLDGSKNIATLGTVGCGAITSTGASTMGSLSVGAVSSSATLHAVGAATFGSSVAASGAITAGTSFIIGSADLNETDLEKLDGITDGTAAANKALVLDSNKDASGLRNLTMTGDMTAGTVTMTGFTVDADGDTALKSLAVDDGSTIGCDSDTDLMSLADGALTVNGTLSADTSFTLDAVTVDATELGYLDGVSAGTAAASKALVLDANKNIGSLNQLTASAIKVDTLDVNTINSVTQTESTLEVLDKKVVTSLSASAANSDGGGFQIGGGADSDGHAAVLWDNNSSALKLEVGGTGRAFVHAGGFDPGQDDTFDLGGVGNEWKDLHLDGVAYIDELRADLLGAALDANNQAITNINVDSGAIDGTVIGANSAAAGTFAALVGTSLSVSDGDITNVGDIALDSISADGNDIDLSLTDNRSAALEIKEGSNNYMVFDTTDGQEGIFFHKEAEFNEGLLVQDDKKIVFGDDDDGSIQFVSAANVVRFDGGSAGLHFNDTSAFGADGAGKDVSFHGAAASELMKYTAADHTLKFVDGSGATMLTLGGDADSEFALDVTDGSANKNKIRAAAFVTYSDERLKTDVTAIENGLETVNNLKAVNFTWKKDGSRDFGFMAQELKQVVPQAVHGSEEGLFGVDYGRLSAILVSAIQEQSAQIASLKKQLENK